MPADRNDDPTIQLWHKVRRPVLAVVFLLLVVGQAKRLISGEPFPTVTAVLLLDFGGWLFFRSTFPDGDRTTTEYWRNKNRADADGGRCGSWSPWDG